MSTSAPRGLASIIVPSWNQLEFTRHCVAALKKHTQMPWELIAIDNGSTDHTDVYLAGVRDGASVPVRIVSNPTNMGFPAAINQGLKAALGEYLVLLNNDVVVTDGWLEQLVGLVNAKRPSVVSSQWSVVADGKATERERLTTPPRERPLAAPPYDGKVCEAESVRPTPTPCVGVVPDSAESTPSGPPFTRGGKVVVRSGVDSVGSSVEEGERGAAVPLLPTADCILPTVRPIGLVGRRCWELRVRA